MKLFFQENTVENVVSKMLVILLKLFCIMLEKMFECGLSGIDLQDRDP